eukprot:CAMPEP_0119315592 /NCGR_PEP_ID=MMETSP1333-20130426/36454_1 /TAXON_ID=418940 /ORGANISM="Scyphosphaera apsteinii, Strain RCC1455" /LENGTH=151 /DNA_ID=CAMNT_0007321007 /DNA_START=3 /DNA_END=458 /DNA_ORIENTATION=+
MPVDFLYLLPALPQAEGSPSLLAPFKKFITPPADDDAAEATLEAMGCVPLVLPQHNRDEGLACSLFEKQLPLLAGGPSSPPSLEFFLPGEELPLNDAVSQRDALADASTIRELRAQLSQWQEVNAELYALAWQQQMDVCPFDQTHQVPMDS